MLRFKLNIFAVPEVRCQRNHSDWLTELSRHTTCPFSVVYYAFQSVQKQNAVMEKCRILIYPYCNYNDGNVRSSYLMAVCIDVLLAAWSWSGQQHETVSGFWSTEYWSTVTVMSSYSTRVSCSIRCLFLISLDWFSFFLFFKLSLWIIKLKRTLKEDSVFPTMQTVLSGTVVLAA